MKLKFELSTFLPVPKDTFKSLSVGTFLTCFETIMKSDRARTTEKPIWKVEIKRVYFSNVQILNSHNGLVENDQN